MYNFGMKKYRSSRQLLLEALIPYTEANIKLAFKPSLFFSDLEKASRYKQRSLQNSFYKLKKQGFIEFGQDGQPYVTDKGMAQLQLYRPKKIKDAHIMVIFDIPEEDRNKRNQLRALLRQLRFVKTQQSVWMTKYECRQYLTAEIERLDLKDYVKVFESRQLI